MRQATKQRQDRVLEQLLARRHVSIHDLATTLGLSQATVRRDLKSLADSHQAQLVHGGATLPDGSTYSFFAKQQRNLDAKLIIGRLAASLVADDDHLFLDSGTTCFAMAEHLAPRRGLHIIVNSARLAPELNGGGGASVIMLGGQYRPDRMDTIGPIALNTLAQLRGYRAFIGADGLSQDDFGVSAADIESADLYAKAVANAKETILLVDHSKFASASLVKIVDWPKIHRLVTDQPPSPSWLDFLAAHQIQVLYPPVE